ncbi:MAG: PorT family protein [Bacteroidales bacterium]|nr:PorT family protein [Bacteroidales bacterium]
MRKLKLSLVIVLLSMVSLVGAQTPSLSVKAGLNMSNFYGSELSDKNMKVGFHAGIGADFDFAPNMAIQSGLFFTSKGAKYTTDIENTELNANANFLQLPVHFAYKIDVMPGTRIVLHAGPYIAYGIGGKTKAGSIEVDTFKDDAFLDVLNGLKPFDAGLGLGVGAEFGRILVDLGWDMGLTNLSRVSLYDVKTQNAYLTLGYKF